MTPDRLAQTRAHEREKAKRHYQDHKEDCKQQHQEYYQENKDRFCQKHVCETCGGHFTIKHKTQHYKTKQHQDALANTCGVRELMSR